MMLCTHHFPPSTPLSYIQYIKPKEVSQKAAPGFREAILNFVLLHVQGYFRSKEKPYWFLSIHFS